MKISTVIQYPGYLRHISLCYIILQSLVSTEIQVQVVKHLPSTGNLVPFLSHEAFFISTYINYYLASSLVYLQMLACAEMLLLARSARLDKT